MTSSDGTPEEIRRSHSERAILEARRSEGNARVGAVIARGKAILATGFKGELDGKHAEQVALQKAHEDQTNIHGATLYTTLEPCADSRTSRVPCCELIVSAGITEVHIGEYDRNPQVYRRGWKYLRDNGVTLRDFPAELRKRVHEVSSDFSSVFTHGTGMSAGAKFDFTQNGGNFEIRADDQPDAPTWKTQWMNCGSTAIYLYGGHPGLVAEARYAEEFSEVDDPNALDYGGSSVRLDKGAIGVLRNKHGHVLCKVMDIGPTLDYGGDGHAFVKIRWEIREVSDF